MVKIHNGKYQFKVPFILYTDFDSILKPVDEKYREKMNQMKTERKGKPSFTEKKKHMYRLDGVYTTHLHMELIQRGS